MIGYEYFNAFIVDTPFEQKIMTSESVTPGMCE